MVLVPAYGRDYKSKAAVLADFEQNSKDFLIADAVHPDSGRYVSYDELVGSGFHGFVELRYDQLRKAAVIKL